MQNFQIPLNLQRWAQVPAFCPARPRASPACARLHPRGLGWKARDTSASGFYSPPGPGAQFCTFNFPFLNCELICCAKKEKLVMSLAANPKRKRDEGKSFFLRATGAQSSTWKGSTGSAARAQGWKVTVPGPGAAPCPWHSEAGAVRIHPLPFPAGRSILHIGSIPRASHCRRDPPPRLIKSR